MNEGMQRRVVATEGLALSSLKSLIKWGDDFKVDEAVIDGQHEKIFRLASEAIELGRDRANSERLRQVFDEFGSVLREHFHYEEQELARMHYPRLDQHRAEHNAMLAELDFLRGRLASKGEGWTYLEEALAILNYMLGVTVGHILHSDGDYARHMHRLTPTGDLLHASAA